MERICRCLGLSLSFMGLQKDTPDEQFAALQEGVPWPPSSSLGDGLEQPYVDGGRYVVCKIPVFELTRAPPSPFGRVALFSSEGKCSVGGPQVQHPRGPRTERPPNATDHGDPESRYGIRGGRRCKHARCRQTCN